MSWRLSLGLDDSCIWLTRVGTRFKNMSDSEFDQVIAVHLKGAYACTKAAWPHFRSQKFGRVVNTSSAAGIYGAFSVGRRGHVVRLFIHVWL